MWLLENYDWPGNIRELENAVVRAAALCDQIVQPEDLPERVRRSFKGTQAPTSSQLNLANGVDDSLLSLADLERRHILRALARTAGNKQAAARILGIDPQHGPDIEGMQVEVDPNVGKHTGGLYESGGRGWVAMPTAEGEQALKPGEWNELEVSVHGAHIVRQLNGTKIVDFTDPAPKVTDGVIGLQIHTGGGVKMRWKDIYLKPE